MQQRSGENKAQRTVTPGDNYSCSPAQTLQRFNSVRLTEGSLFKKKIKKCKDTVVRMAVACSSDLGCVQVNKWRMSQEKVSLAMMVPNRPAA